MILYDIYIYIYICMSLNGSFFFFPFFNSFLVQFHPLCFAKQSERGNGKLLRKSIDIKKWLGLNRIVNELNCLWTAQAHFLFNWWSLWLFILIVAFVGLCESVLYRLLSRNKRPSLNQRYRILGLYASKDISEGRRFCY